MSKSGMKTVAWGPPTWKAMFFIALGYPTSPTMYHREAYRRWFEGLGDVLPCSYCRASYRGFFAEEVRREADCFADREAVFRLVYRLKNRVNQKLHDQEREEFTRQFNALSASDRSNSRLVYDLMRKIMRTVASPPLAVVRQEYEQFRGTCSPNHNKCV